MRALKRSTELGLLTLLQHKKNVCSASEEKKQTPCTRERPRQESVWRCWRCTQAMLLHAPQECLVPLEQKSLDPVEQECKAILKQLVEAVATRHVVAEQATLLAELEDYQAQCWTRDEARHRERQRLRALAAAPASQPHHSARARSPAEGMRRAQRSESPSARSAQGSESSDASVQGALRPRRRAKLRSLSAQVDADFSALANRMQALGVGVQPPPQPPRPSRSSGGDGGGSGRPGGSAGSSASAGGGAAAPVGAAPRRIGSCGGVIDVPRRGGGQRVGRAGAPGAPPAAAAAAPLDDRAYVETLLPSAPPGRSQFVFEVEAPIQSHAQSQALARPVEQEGTSGLPPGAAREARAPLACSWAPASACAQVEVCVSPPPLL